MTPMSSRVRSVSGLVPSLLIATAALAVMHPAISSLNARERQRDMLAQAEQLRTAREFGRRPGQSRRAQAAARQPGRGRVSSALLVRLLHRTAR
jgi:hypothetical protein